MGILVEICLRVFRVPYFCIAFTPKAILVPSCISKILSEREQIPLQTSDKNMFTMLWKHESQFLVDCKIYKIYYLIELFIVTHLYHPVYNLYAYNRLKNTLSLQNYQPPGFSPVPTLFPGSLSYPSRSVWIGKREPWERGWKSINHEQWHLMNLWVELY